MKSSETKKGLKDPVVQEGAAVLRQKAKHVPKKDFGSKALSALVKKMSKVLAAEEFGVALAAPQVDASLRLFIVAGHVFKQDADDVGEKTPPDMAFINPEIIRLSRKKREMSEGCLSVRGQYGTVLRHERATVRAQDEQGNAFTYHGSGLLGHIFQHECDHLEGVLYIDKAEKLRHEAQRKELRDEFPA
ncbi:MAG: peptide deformylase [bacterium]